MENGTAYDLLLYKKDKGKWVKEPHATLDLNGRAKYLKNDCLHYTYRNLSHQLERIDKYTSMSAVEMNKKDVKFFLAAYIQTYYQIYQRILLQTRISGWNSWTGIGNNNVILCLHEICKII